VKHRQYMHRALELAKKGIGKVSPNPLVGCVIAKNKKIIGEGFHVKFGSTHAEINALKKAGINAQGADLYVNLEPCCHYGKTPPCTKAILNAGIKKVFVAMLDPNPLVAGKGIKILQKNGIEVKVGIEATKAKKLNEKFIYFIQHRTPFVALKIATTANGKITRSDGKKWITNAESRKKVHQLRNEYHAILVGKNTVLDDNPSLTTYKLKNGNNPLRIILDSNLEIPTEKKVFADSHFIIMTKKENLIEKKEKYLKLGGQILECEKQIIDLKSLLKKLGKKGISSLFVEGGAEVYRNFFAENLVQKVYWFQAPFNTGENALGIEKVLERIKQKRTQLEIKKYAEDTLKTIYFKQ